LGQIKKLGYEGVSQKKVGGKGEKKTGGGVGLTSIGNQKKKTKKETEI